jgi:hypothetical protein
MPALMGGAREQANGTEPYRRIARPGSAAWQAMAEAGDTSGAMAALMDGNVTYHSQPQKEALPIHK